MAVLVDMESVRKPNESIKTTIREYLLAVKIISEALSDFGVVGTEDKAKAIIARLSLASLFIGSVASEQDTSEIDRLRRILQKAVNATSLMEREIRRLQTYHPDIQLPDYLDSDNVKRLETIDKWAEYVLSGARNAW